MSEEGVAVCARTTLPEAVVVKAGPWVLGALLEEDQEVLCGPCTARTRSVRPPALRGHGRILKGLLLHPAGLGSVRLVGESWACPTQGPRGQGDRLLRIGLTPTSCRYALPHRLACRPSPPAIQRPAPAVPLMSFP